MDPEVEVVMDTFVGRPVLIHDGLRLVALTSAAMIIKECKMCKPTGGAAFLPSKESIFNELNTNINWLECGIIGGLRSHVQIIHEMVSYVMKSPQPNKWLLFDEAKLLVKALDTFQMWKESYIKQERQKKGMDWGTATAFCKEVWNIDSEELLDSYSK